MKAFEQYWTFSAIRGVLTIIAAAGILAVPHAANAMLSLPILVAFSIDVLAAYTLLDAGAMFLLANVMPEWAHSRKMRLAQAAAAVVLGSALCLLTWGTISPKYLLFVVALQAAVAAVSEAIVARDTHAQYGCLSCYSTAMVLAACALALPFATGLDATSTTLVLAGYVAAYGLSQFLLAARMLFVEYRAEHPAAVMSDAWRAEMVQPAAATATACISCEACPADTMCRDYTLQGQVARVAAARQPAIVRTVRIASLMEPAGIYRGR